MLLAEDDWHVREVVADALRLGGYEVLEAANPSEALALSQRRADSTARLITDLVMPELNGLQLAELLRTTHILAIHPGALGDVLQAVPALRALRSLGRGASVTFAGQPRLAHLLAGGGAVGPGGRPSTLSA